MGQSWWSKVVDPVLHYDADFDHVAAVTRQPTQSIVERGTVD